MQHERVMTLNPMSSALHVVPKTRPQVPDHFRLIEIRTERKDR